MSFVSYAQNFEDVRLWRAFSDVAKGRYLDIGTQDPVADSVSLAFYERGWRGVHVEPTPAYAAKMRAARPDETVIEAAVSTSPGPIRFFEIPETGLSTGLANLAERHAGDGWTPKEITVPTVTLAALFDLMGSDPIHWLKVDVEGMEADVLASWGDHPARPQALVIEATAPNSQIPTHEAWYDLVLSRGYRDVLFDGLSRYFTHETQANRGMALALSPNVFDGFQVTASHFVSGKVVSEKEVALEDVRAQGEAQCKEAVTAIDEQAKATLQAARTELEERIAALQRLLAETKEALAETQAEGQSLASEAGQLRGRLTAQAEAAEERIAALQRLLAETKVALAETQAEGQSLASEAGQLRGRLTAQAEAAEERIAALQRLLAETKVALAETQAEGRSLALEVGQLRGRLTTQAEAAASQLREAEVTRRELTEQLAISIQRVTQNEVELQQEQARGKALGAQLTAANSVNAQLSDQLAVVNGALAESQRRETNLAAQVSEIDEQLAASEAQRLQAQARGAARDEELAQLQIRLARQEQQLTQAVELLDHAPDPIEGWPRRLATRLARIANRRPEVIAANRAASIETWRAGLVDHFDRQLVSGDFTVAVNTDLVDWAAIQGNPFMSADEGPITSVPRLLAPHDAEFIRVAYQAVLGRGPDPVGGTYYLGRLRSGTHKLEILKQLRRSPEGRNFIPGVAGLDRAIRRHHRANLPIAGLVIRFFSGAEGNGATQRHLRVITNEVGRLSVMQVALAKLVTATDRSSPRDHAEPKAAAVDVPAEAGTGNLADAALGERPREGLVGFFQREVWTH